MNRAHIISNGLLTVIFFSFAGSIEANEIKDKQESDPPKVRLSLKIAEAKRDTRKSGIYRSILRKTKSGLIRRP